MATRYVSIWFDLLLSFLCSFRHLKTYYPWNKKKPSASGSLLWGTWLLVCRECLWFLPLSMHTQRSQDLTNLVRCSILFLRLDPLAIKFQNSWLFVLLPWLLWGHKTCAHFLAGSLPACRVLSLLHSQRAYFFPNLLPNNSWQAVSRLDSDTKIKGCRMATKAFVRCWISRILLCCNWPTKTVLLNSTYS